jgi:hypothetical protein
MRSVEIGAEGPDRQSVIDDQGSILPVADAPPSTSQQVWAYPAWSAASCRRWVLPVWPAPPPPSQWYDDPAGRHELRHWDQAWLSEVVDGGRFGRDPLGGLELPDPVGAAWDLGMLTRVETAAIVEALEEEGVVTEWDGRVLRVDAEQGDLVEAVVCGACPEVVFQEALPMDGGATGAVRSGRFSKIDIRHLKGFERAALRQTLADDRILFGDDGSMLTVAMEDLDIVWQVVDIVSD